MASIYTDLDSVLDTRLSFLGLLTNNGKFDIGPYKNYSNRYKNNFGYLSDYIFNTYYNKRNKHVLTNAYPVETLSLMQDFIKDDLSTNTIDNDEHTIYVNIYPYDLTEDETRVIIEQLFMPLFPTINIKIIDVNYDLINPEWIKTNNIKLLVMYDGLKWVEDRIRDRSLLEKDLMDVMLIAPLLLDHEVRSDQITEDFRKSMVLHYRMLIDLRLTPSGVFSLMANGE